MPMAIVYESSIALCFMVVVVTYDGSVVRLPGAFMLTLIVYNGNLGEYFVSSHCVIVA